MGNTRIPRAWTLAICFILAIVFGTGCSYQRQYRFKPVGMPEEVYVRDPIQTRYTPDIVVLSFQSPGYSWPVGEEASKQLCTEILKSGARAHITFNDTAAFTNSDQLARFARENRYDYIVTGKVLYYFNGAATTDSRVEEEIKIYGVSGKKLRVVGYAKAVETAPPLSSTDFILVKGHGASAPSAESLLKRNAGKFARLIGGMLSEKSTGVVR